MNEQIYLLDNPSVDDIYFLKNKLIENNKIFVGDNIRTPIAVFYQDEKMNRIGGCSGHTYGNWLYIEYLWIDNMARKKGMGSHILLAIEDFARSRECQFSLLDTFSFQARPFYEKHGYSVKMTLDDYPADQKRYYMTKNL
jgi:GNAT superfamily N-acetyltransferase